MKCDGCKEIIYSKELARNDRICPKCGFHFRISVPERIDLLLDEGSPSELFERIAPGDPLKFKDTKAYRDRLKRYQDQTGVLDAVVVVQGTIDEEPVILAVMDYRFMGGSMGSRRRREDHPCAAERAAVKTKRPARSSYQLLRRCADAGGSACP